MENHSDTESSQILGDWELSPSVPTTLESVSVRSNTQKEIETIKISRFSSSDFTVDQIPIIFSGYTAESEDSSSSSEEMSDDSRTYSKSSDENEEIDQERSRSVRKRTKLKVLKRQSTRGQMRSLKKNLDLLQPHYLRPTSSSSSKNVENIQKNLEVARLKRIASLRYNRLLKATCSSAMKGSSKKSNDVCTYRYCSLHGQVHSHGVDSNVSVPSLKRFVSMRRKVLKRQKSVNRRLVLLKRNLSRKRGGIVTDQESKQKVFEEDGGNDSESIEKVMVDGVMDSIESVQESKPEIMDAQRRGICQQTVMGLDHDDVDGESNQDVFEEDGANDSESNGRSTENVMVGVDDNDVDGVIDSIETVQESNMDDSDDITDKDLEKKDAQRRHICQQTVMGLDHDDGEISDMKSKETVGVMDSIETVQESKQEIMDDSDDAQRREICQQTRLDHMKSEDNEEACREGSYGEMREEEGKKTEHLWNETVTLVKQAFDEILMEITDDDSSDDVSIRKDEPLDDVGADSSDSDMKPIEGKDTHLSVIVSTSQESEKGPKKWSYLKRIILLKSFLKSLERREKRKASNGEDSERITRLRRELVGEKKNAEEWMLDHALRQVISTLAPPQKRKVKHLVKAFESLNPMDDLSRGLGREENEIMIVKDNKEDSTDLSEETKLTSEVSIDVKSDEALELGVDESSCNASALGSSVEVTEDSEKQNLSTWKSLIQKNMAVRDNSETKQEHKWSYGNDAAVKTFQQAFEKILSEIPDSSIVSESSKPLKEEKEHEGETKRSWNSLRKVILLKRFVKSLEKVRVFNPKKLRNLPVESEFESENVLLRHRAERRRRTDGEELMLDYALRQAISRLAPIERKKVELLVQAFDTVLDGHDTPKQTKTDDETGEKHLVKAFDTVLDGQETPKQTKTDDETGEELLVQAFDTVLDGQDTPKQIKNDDETGEELFVKAFNTVLDGQDTPKQTKKTGEEEDCEVNKDEQKIKSVFGRFQVHQKGEEEIDSTPKETRNLPPIGNVKQRIVIEKEKDSRMWKLIYKHMVTEKEGTDLENGESVASVEDECDEGAKGLKSDTVTLVKEALEKILSEIPDNSSDDQSMDRDITMEQEKNEITSKPKSNEKRGWNNVKKVILLRRFVSDLGKLSPKTPRVLPWEPDPETEKIRLRHQEVGGKRNSEEWMLDYALRQAISTLAPSQKRKVSLLAQAFDTISIQDMGSGSTVTSRNISRQSSVASTVVHNENEGNAEILRGKLRNLQEETTKLENDLEEKQQCSSLWRLLCKQMEDNERNQTLSEETIEDEEDTNVDGEKKELYQTEAVELLGEVIDGISIEESQQETLQVTKVKSNRWNNLKKVILLRRFVKALDNVRKFNPREPQFLPHSPEIEGEKVNLKHQETQNKKNSDEWMVDNTLQEVVSKLTPARKLKVQLLVQAFETLSATGN